MRVDAGEPRSATGGPTGLRPPFTARLRHAVTGDNDIPLVLVGNFEVEEAWAEGEIGLPRLGGPSATASLVNQMDEFALLLGKSIDHVILKSKPDDDHLAYLAALGLDLPHVHVTDVSDPERTVTEDALDSPALLAELRSLAENGSRVFAHGLSDREVRLAQSTGLHTVHPALDVVKTVNGKGYSRDLCDELGIPQASGWVCHTVDDFVSRAHEIRYRIDTGERVGVKDAFGVSGKGIVVLDDPRRLDQLIRMVERRAARSGNDRLAVVVESWADKDRDFNYHFTISRSGTVEFDFVQEAITESGVHKGHRLGSRLDEELVDTLRDHAQLLGDRLYRDGFWGPVGVDAITVNNGSMLPVLDINARNNMSTYQVPLRERFLGSDQVAMARHYPLTLSARLPFHAVTRILGDAIFTPESGRGVIINNFATVNAALAGADSTFSGRLYGFLLADSEADLAELDRTIAARLDRGLDR